jgi:hypothetical protein
MLQSMLLSGDLGRCLGLISVFTARFWMPWLLLKRFKREGHCQSELLCSAHHAQLPKGLPLSGKFQQLILAQV